ncbi:MAG: hypothetical protein IJM62_03415 [Lachnospiraceae bacterium]|nr:hypothetical protein [Lachnospiraceae bacterium]
MFRLWGIEVKDNRHIRETVITDEDQSHTRTQKIFGSVEKVCREFDLPAPIWLDPNINDIKYHKKTRFNRDNFIEELDFDYLEIKIIEE